MSLADEKEPTRVLWYGEPGSAKTTDMADAAKHGTLHVIDADGGLKARALRDFDIPADNIEPYRDIRFNSLWEYIWELKESLDDDPDSVYCLGVDTWTEISERFLGAIVDKEQGKKIAKLEREGQDTEDVDPFFRDRSYYGTLAEQIRRLLREMKAMNVHLAFTAHVRRDEDENTKKVIYGPAVSPAVQGHLVGAVDLVAYCTVDGAWPDGYEVAGEKGADVMIAHMRRIGDHLSPKDRFHATPRVLVNPTFSRIQGYVEGTLTADNDEQQAAYREIWQARKAEADEVKAAREARKAEARARATGSVAKKTAAKKTAAGKKNTQGAPHDESDDPPSEDGEGGASTDA